MAPSARRIWATFIAVAGAVIAVSATARGAGGGSGARTQLVVWAAPTVAQQAALGGASYGGGPTGAMITEQREVDVAANGEVRIVGVASTIDAASVQLRDLTEPGVAIAEQRFTPGANTPTEMLARHVGAAVTVVTPRGETNGTLRSVDETALVIEIGSGDQRKLSIMRRDYVQDVRVSGGAVDKPSVSWRLATKKPGRHNVELTYRAEGITWSADYLAVIDEGATKIDFSAWATVKNASGTSFDNAEVTLVGTSPLATPGVAAAKQPSAHPRRFTTPTPVRIGANDSVQVELIPARVGAKTRTVVTYEAMPDPSGGTTVDANVECSSFNGSGMGNGRAEAAVELDLPGQTALPDGRVRLFRRRGERLEVVNEDQLRSTAGLARVKLALDNEVAGERKAVSCNNDEHARTLTEKIEVRVENKGKQAVDVVIREFMWRWSVWRIDGEDKKGTTVAPQTHEYRVRVPSKGSQNVTYTVVYSW
ncbi:MAG: hypothetical protein KIT31_22500 [Deltaproteobacteria bacterium]|nr:hypothetical protein [Deltaproteobacteria bacterium]